MNSLNSGCGSICMDSLSSGGGSINLLSSGDGSINLLRAVVDL